MTGADTPEAWKRIYDRFQPSRSGRELIADARNDLERVYYRHGGRLAHKWHHYLEVYDRFLTVRRGTGVRLLEIGVDQGGSLEIWREYLGPKAVMHGLDANPACAAVSCADLPVHIGDQADTGLLSRIVAEMGGLDIVIDDGAHIGSFQIASFECLFPMMDRTGVYFCEDLHTAYWEEWDGGLRTAGTFIEYAKSLVDALHRHYLPEDVAADHLPTVADIRCIGFWDSIVVVEKWKSETPFHLKSGRRKAKPDAAPGA